MAKIEMYSIEFYEKVLEGVEGGKKLLLGSLMFDRYCQIYQKAVAFPDKMREYIQDLREHPENYANVRVKMNETDTKVLAKVLSLKSLAVQVREGMDKGLEILIAQGKISPNVRVHGRKSKFNTTEGMKGRTGTGE